MKRNLLSKPAYHLLLVLILGILGYSNTFNVPFQFDDVPNIVENPVIKNLDYYITPAKAKLYKGFGQYSSLINRYIGSFTFALNYKVHGLDVAGYHVVNLLIHLFNAFLVYWFVQLTFIILASRASGENPLFLKHTSTIAFFSSLLFVTHPIQTQSVTYIVQRFTSLATMFYLLSIIMYIKARLTICDTNGNDGGKISIRAFVYYLTALVAAVLAIKTKEIALTLPFFIVLYDWYFLQDLERGWLKKYGLLVGSIGCLLILAAFFFYLGKDPLNHLLAGYGVRDFTLTERLLTESRVVIFYLSLLILPLPSRLNLDHDFVVSQSLLAPANTILSMIGLALLFGLAIFLARRHRLLSFGIIWFLGNLTMESSFIPLEIIFEHRLYLPSLGIFLVISVLLVMVIERCQQKWVEGTIISIIIITALVFTGTTYSRNNIWNDKILLWQDIVNKSPKKVRGHSQLGLAYADQGNLDKAIKSYNKAIFVDPYYYTAYYNLGNAYLYKGLTDEAIKMYIRTINLNPSHHRAYSNLGSAYLTKGLIDEAITACRNAITIKPSHVNAYVKLGRAYFAKGLIDEAITALRNAININPSHANAHFYLGRAYGEKGLFKEARSEMKRGAMLRNLK